MPLGFERLNERSQRPNAHINFIKTVSTGADKAVAQEFLSRIAAQCYPVMKMHYITVMALEEYPCNPEFLGRNFNAGEVIQLVLKDKQGRWLSFKFVQMVMMHELAHCKQMNHGKLFWSIRNEYAKQMEDLWKDKYEGEGLWGRGRGLAHGAFVYARPPDNTQIPEHLCGGSYRRRGMKRKRGGQQDQEDGAKLSYAERQQKRIEKKLGKHGVSMRSEILGDDELTRGALERMNGGKRAAGKPRVANSKRGRDLRANAALARFEAMKQQSQEKTPELQDDLGSETESEWDDSSASGFRDNAVVIKNEHGHDMVKVCGDDEDDEESADREMDELRLLSCEPDKGEKTPRCSTDDGSETDSEADKKPVPGMQESTMKEQVTASNGQRTNNIHEKSQVRHGTHMAIEYETEDEIEKPQRVKTVATDSAKAKESSTPLAAQNGMLICSICSLENDPNSPICLVCSHVLRTRLVPNHWSCKMGSCKDSPYINAGDAGRCGICGSQRPTSATASASSRRPGAPVPMRSVGLTGADVLRWD